MFISKSKIIIFLASILLFLNCFASDTSKYKWRYHQSLDHSNLKNVVNIDDSYLIFGENITKLTNKWIKEFHPKTPLTIKKSFTNAFDNIWIANYTSTYESNLFHFDGSRWKEVFNPFGNQIDAMFFENSSRGVIGGLSELALYNNGNWEFIDLPFSGVIRKIIRNSSNDIYLLETSKGLWKYDGVAWSKELDNLSISTIEYVNDKLAYALSDSSLYILQDKKWKLHSNSTLLKGILDISILDVNNIWGCGPKGKIVLYKNSKWIKYKSNFQDNLNSISMNSDTNGTIVAHDGIVLKYDSFEHSFIPYKLGFKKRHVMSDSKIIDDKYGVVFSDFTNNGYADIIAIGAYEDNNYYINNKSNFIESSKTRGLSKTDATNSGTINTLNLGVVAGDIDSDGDNDLFVSSLNNKNYIYKNYNNGFFRLSDFAQSTISRSNAASMSDIDNDGDIDIFVVNENASNKLYLNDGNGFFSDKTEQVNLSSLGGGNGCTLADIDNDDDIDIIVVNWASENKIYKNLLSENGKLQFVDQSEKSNISGFAHTKSNGVILFDADNDADLDLFITSRKTSNRFYTNNGSGIFTDVTQTNIGFDSSSSYGVVAFDADNDGDKDLYISNVGNNQFLENNGTGFFKPATNKFQLNMGGYSTGSAVADVDNDGDIDIFQSNFTGASSLLFVNKRNDNNFIKIKVIGTKSNINGIGTKIYIYKTGSINEKNSLISFGEIQAGSGYASSNDFIFHSGIIYDTIDILVYFPKSQISREYLGVQKGQLFVVNEEEGLNAILSINKKRILNFIKNKIVHFEILKFMIVLVAIFYFSYKGKKIFNWNSFQILLNFFLFNTFYWLHIYFFQYNSFLLSTFLPITGVLFIQILLHVYLKNRLIHKVALLDKINTRERISRDLHDDVASTLSSISMYNESLKRIINSPDEKANKIFDKINILVHDAANSVSNIVWSSTPKHDNFEALVVKIKLIVTDACSNNKLTSSFSVSEATYKHELSGTVRHNVFMIFKEALHNIIKHANANKIIINIYEKDKFLFFSISDDGIGFEVSDNSVRDNSSGNGINNIKKRAEQIDANIEINSEIGKGTRIIIKIKNNTNELLST